MSIDVMNLFNRREDNRWNRVCVSDMVERLTWSTPARTALTGWEGAYSEPRFRSLSYAELDALTTRIANGLLARGLQRGDRAMMFSENSVEGYAFKLGVAKAGMVAVALNPALAADVVVQLLERIEPRLIVADVEYWQRFAPHVAATGRAIDLAIEIGGAAPAGITSFGDFVDAASAAAVEVTIHGDDIWEILHTSGTTSLPKSAMLSHTSTVLAAHGFALSLTRNLRFESDLVVVTFLPMLYHIGHHIFPLAAFAAGGGVVIGRKHDAAQIAAAIEAERATAMWAGSPAMLGGLLAAVQAGRWDISSLGTAVYGWAQLPPATLAGLRKHAPDLRVFAIHGQTECIPCHRFWTDKWSELWERTSPAVNYVGIPSPLLAARIIDEKGDTVVSPGVPGEAVFRSPVMTAGYYRDEKATAEAFHGGWFHSGDMFQYGTDGLRVMLDRYKDVVKSGGESVSTIRVESVLSQHPAVQKAAVIGIPDERWGERVTAVVVLNESGEAPDEAALIAFARERLAGFETPKQVIFVDQLPETVGGKVMKYRLREQYR